MIAHLKTEPNGTVVYLVRDPRGESADYEAVQLVGYGPAGEVRWFEGVRKDRTDMRPEWRELIEPWIVKVH